MPLLCQMDSFKRLHEDLCQVQGLSLLEMFTRTEHLLLKILPHACILVTQRFVIILVRNRNGVWQENHNFVTQVILEVAQKQSLLLGQFLCQGRRGVSSFPTILEKGLKKGLKMVPITELSQLSLNHLASEKSHPLWMSGTYSSVRKQSENLCFSELGLCLLQLLWTWIFSFQFLQFRWFGFVELFCFACMSSLIIYLLLINFQKIISSASGYPGEQRFLSETWQHHWCQIPRPRMCIIIFWMRRSVWLKNVSFCLWFLKHECFCLWFCHLDLLVLLVEFLTVANQVFDKLIHLQVWHWPFIKKNNKIFGFFSMYIS